MEFIEILKQWAANGTSIRKNVRYLGLSNVVQWEKPISTVKTNTVQLHGQSTNISLKPI